MIFVIVGYGCMEVLDETIAIGQTARGKLHTGSVKLSYFAYITCSLGFSWNDADCVFFESYLIKRTDYYGG